MGPSLKRRKDNVRPEAELEQMLATGKGPKAARQKLRSIKENLYSLRGLCGPMFASVSLVTPRLFWP